MRFVDLIEKKKAGLALTKDEIQFWIDGYVKGDIPDYQVSALLMAIVFKGMNDEETLNLTMAMMHSGDVIDLSGIEGIKVDKHSTGGVGDKTTLVLGPMVAACGVKLAKMSGRGLGFTGGTIDKLESITGFHVNLDREAFIRQVNEIGIAVVGQSGNLVPADKKLYALRDVTGTIGSIPLIASSIMSKKLAAGSDVIVLDVKYGDGAFMKTPEAAQELAQTMIRIGTGAGRRVRAVISSMEAPLGFAIGNTLEVQEAIAALSGHGPEDLMDLCMTAGSLLLKEAGAAPDEKAAAQMLAEVIADGRALDKLAQMAAAQGGDASLVYHPEKMAASDMVTEIKASESGHIHRIEAMLLGNLAMQIGAGRATKEDTIENEVGIVLRVKPGAAVSAGDVLAVVHHSRPLDDSWLAACEGAFHIDDVPFEAPPLIYKVL